MIKVTSEDQERVLDALPDDRQQAYATLVAITEAVLFVMEESIDEFATKVQNVRILRNQGVFNNGN